MDNINTLYTKFYNERKHVRIYPTEFVVRTFLSSYLGLNYEKPNGKGQTPSKILDVGFGDGRNTLFLCEQNYDVYGIEITKDIVEQTNARLRANGVNPMPDLRVGRNSSIPYNDNYFDYILACHSCYYIDDGQTINDNLKEYYRVLSPGGWLIASVLHKNSYILKESKPCDDGSMIVVNDPYGTRIGCRLHGFSDKKSIEDVFSVFFQNFCFGQAHNNYYGIDENVFWIVCQKKSIKAI